MGDVRLFIAIACAILVSLCSSDSLSPEENTQDEPLRMASDSLVVKSYKTAESSSLPPTDSDEEKSDSYQTYQGVMGRPGVDYPVFSGIPVTSFSCRNVKKSGYYADLETDCQVFHVCDRNRKISFLCPNGTIFRQSHLICDWWFRVDCGRSVELYDESAEQLEADQQVYKARSEERESRRRKQNRLVTSRKNSDAASSKDQSGQRRKPERNSKKVSGFVRDQSSTHFSENENIQFKNQEKIVNNFTVDEGQVNPKESNSDNQQLDELTSTQNQNYEQNLQSIGLNNNKESFYEAESGSFVEDLSARSRNYAASLKNNNNFGQTQPRQNNFGGNSGQKRTSKKLNLNSRERNEYFSSNKQVTEHKVESFSEENSSISYESSGNRYHSFTSSTGSSTGGNFNRQQEQTNQAFTQYRDNQNTNQNSAFQQSEEQRSHSLSGSNPTNIQSSKIVQNNYISTQVTGQNFQNDNGKVHNRLTSSNNTAIRQNVVNNGVSNSKQLVYSSTSVTNEQPDFNRNNFEQVTATERNGNFNFGPSATTQPVHNFKHENAGNFESRFNTFSSTPSSFAGGNTNQNFGNSNTESTSSHTSNQPSTSHGAVKFSSSFRSGQSNFDRAQLNHNFGQNNKENFKQSFGTSDFSNNFSGQQNNGYNEGDRNAAFKYSTVTSSTISGSIPTHSKTSSTIGQQDPHSSLSNKNTQSHFQSGSFSFGQSNANNDNAQFDYSTASTILPPHLDDNKNFNHNLRNSQSSLNGGGSFIGQNINFNTNVESDSQKTSKNQFENNFNVNGFTSTTSKPTYTTTTSFHYNNGKISQGFGTSNSGNVQTKALTSFTTNSQQSVVNDEKERTNHFEYTTTPSTNKYQSGDANNNGKEDFNFGFSTTVKPVNTFNGITGNGKTGFSFGTYTDNKNYEYSSNIPFSTAQQSPVFNNRNTAFGSNINQRNQQSESEVQKSVTELVHTTTPTTQSIFRQVNSAFSFSNFNSNNNNLQSNQNTVNNNFGSTTTSQGTSVFNGNKNINGDFGPTTFGSLTQNDGRENGNFGFTSQQGSSSGPFYSQQFVSTNKNAEYNTATVNHNTEIKEVKYEGSYKLNKDENSRPQAVNQIKSTSFGANSELRDDSASIFTTETYESKRTNPIVRKETTSLPPNTQSTYFLTSQRSSPAYVEEEKQYLAETASFGSNPGGNQYSDFKNQFDVSDKRNRIDVTTEKFYQTTYESSGSTESYLTGRPVTNQFPTDSAHLKTISNTPLQQNSENVYFASTSSVSPLDEAQFITTARPFYETTTPANVYNTAEDIYYKSTASSNSGDEAQKFDLSFGLENKSLSSEVNLSLQELNINKDVPQANESGKTYEDLVRDGLEVPPSSGPNAIRSFALYFGTKNYTDDNETITSHPVSHHTDLSPTLSSFELKKKEVVKQVDELVQQSSINTTGTSATSREDKLPNSLTVHTQETYLELFPKGNEDTNDKETTTKAYESNSVRGEFEFGTTDFGAFTEEPTVINSELGLNDLDLSQTRGLLEPEPSDAANAKSNNAHVTPDLRRLAQVFTKALSAYLDDPHAFKKILSEIRPTEPTIELEGNTFAGSDYPSATQEVDEVLDFSDVTKSTYRKKFPTTVTEREITTEPVTEIYNSSLSEFENLIFPLNQSSWATNIELTAPVLETLDESQSSYYTPPPFTGTTNQVAEEINGFITSDKSTFSEESGDVDSYLPSTTTDPTAKYGGFQNNNKKTTKYSPYGAELSSTPFPPLGINSFSKSAEAKSDVAVPTSTDVNSTSFFSHFTQNRTKEEEIQLAKELNNLVLLQKFTTPRGTTAESTTAQPNLSTSHLTTGNEAPQYLDVKLGNGETLEREASTNRGGKNLYLPGSNVNSNYFEPTAKEINLELSPVSSTPKGFLITYSLSSQETSSRQPTFTKLDVQPTTYAPEKASSLNFVSETAPPLDLSGNMSPSVQSYLEYNGVSVESTTPQFARSIKSLDRIVELQEALMFNTNNSTVQQKDEAREMVDQMVGSVNVTTTTTQTLMKMMEMAAKNETYKRLVLLLVNDKSAKNKTVEEARLSLLKALLTPVISPEKSVVPISTTSKLVQNDHVGSLRRSKSIRSDAIGNPAFTTTSSTVPPVTTRIPTTTTTTTTTSTATTPTKANNLASTVTTPSPPSSITTGKVRRTKITKINVRNENSRKKSDLGNIDILRRTIENSKNKQVNINSIDESAILSSDSRAVELLKSLYSLAARWG